MSDAVIVIDIVDGMRGRGEMLAVAESLTGGLLAATIVDVPGASDVLRGGVVAYHPDVKRDVLGVDPADIERVGTVSDEVAAAMAVGVARHLGATWGVSTTGVAGPQPSEGKPVGRVHVGVAGPGGVTVRRLALPGDRLAIRQQTVAAALSALVARLGEESRAGGR